MGELQKITEKTVSETLLDGAYILVTQQVDGVEVLRRVPLSVLLQKCGSGDGSVDDDALAQAVAAYLTEHPPEDGDKGKSAYEYAVDGGYTGTEEEFAALLADAVSGDESYETYFDIDCDGLVSLKAEYRGRPSATTYPYAVSDMGVGVEGSKISELPEKVVIPDVIDGTAVTGVQAGMFYCNERLRELVLPDAVEEIPTYFCREAMNLRTIHNTERITKIATLGFAYTRVEKLMFPNLTEVEDSAFGACGFLYSVDIGKITKIPDRTFMQCCLLSAVKGGENVTTIGLKAFLYTKNLKNLPLLSNVTSIGDYAFFGSRVQFDWSTIDSQCTYGSMATPVLDNTTDFWSGVEYTPCENPLITKMSQRNAEWTGLYYGDAGVVYLNACAVFASIHIHSALSGKVYTHPDGFAEELRAIDSSFLTESGWPGKFANVAPLFNALGYKTTVYEEDLTAEIYQAMCEALARGAYVYSQVSTTSNADGGHAVVIYGINSNGEVLVLDSDLLYEKYRETGLSDDLYVYRMPYQNLVGPSSNFVVVEKS